MKKVVVVGSSAVGAKALEIIRNQEPTWELTLIAVEGFLPYKKELLGSFLAKETTLNNLLYKDKNFYEKNNIQVLIDCVITRINLKKKRIHTEKKEQIDCDVLILADLPDHRFPEIKGVNKTGVWGLQRLKDLAEVNKALGFVDTVAIQADDWAGLEAVAAIKKRGKEVVLLLSTQSFLVSALDADVLSWLVTTLETNGIKILESNPIVEVLGDTEAMAIRLQSGKVLACQTVLISETKEDTRLFSEQLLEFNPHVNVAGQFQTNLEGVYAVEGMCNYETNVDIRFLPFVEEQGRVVAQHILGQETSLNAPFEERSLVLGSITISTLGRCAVGESTTEYKRFDSVAGTYQKIFVENNMLVGAILLNLETKKDSYRKFILEKSSLNESFFADFNISQEGSVSIIAPSEGNLT